MNRFFLAQDNDSHWWIVPVDRHADFAAWAEADPEDANRWKPMDFFAIEVGGCPGLVTFTDPQIIDR